MKIEEARKLKLGDRVWCPADRGNPAFTGTVDYLSGIEASHPSSNGPFLWVGVAASNGTRGGHWPSNRLEKV